MRYSGPFGLSRVTGIGPLVSNKSSYEQRVTESKATQAVKDAAEDEDIDVNDMTDEEIDRIITAIGEELYPEDSPSHRAKRARFDNCMRNRWVNNWVEAFEDDPDGPDVSDNRVRLRLMAQACAGMTSANTADSEELIPAQFKT